MIRSVLLIVNSASGTGTTSAVAESLLNLLRTSLPEAVDDLRVVQDHPAAQAAARQFLTASQAPAAIIVGGGGGTLRAVIEGVCAGTAPGRLPGVEKVRMAALRMGSGNLLARRLGMPKDLQAGLKGIIENLRHDRTVPACLIRCETFTREGTPAVHFAAAMAGLGQFGRTPGDLARWHGRLPGIRKAAARLLGLEKLNNWEYLLALGLRMLSCSVAPRKAEAVEANAPGENRRMKLLAGAVLCFPFEELPFDPGVKMGEQALAVYLIPMRGRFTPAGFLLTPRRLLRSGWHFQLTAFQRLDIRLLDREPVEFFLDEDPTVAFRSITLRVAGTLAFVPGPEYASSTDIEATA